MTTSEITETQRDLHADLAIINAASVGPWIFEPSKAPEWDGGFEGGIIAHSGEYVCDFGDSTQYYPSEGSPPSPEDATFIAEARTAWPHAIERAITAERRVRELCESNAYYIKQAERAEEDSYYTREELESTRKELEQLRAGIAAAMTYPPGIIRAKLSRILAEVIADE